MTENESRLRVILEQEEDPLWQITLRLWDSLAERVAKQQVLLLELTSSFLLLNSEVGGIDCHDSGMATRGLDGYFTDRLEKFADDLNPDAEPEITPGDPK